VTDKESGNARLPHRLDEATGMYRGRQIAPARTTKVSVPKVKGPSTLEAPHDHAHDHAAHAHDNAEVKSEEGVKGKVATGARPKKGE
jgi:hypothetical protein